MKTHFLLNNPRGEKLKFDASRGFESQPEDILPLPQAYRQQKQRLRNSLTQFSAQLIARIKERTLSIPNHIDYIRIDFFVVFNNSDEFKTKTRFRNEFGLVPAAYANFNQTVYFAIADHTKFAFFVSLLMKFIDSPDINIPHGTEYSIITLLYDFKFLSSERIIVGQPEGDVIFSLVKKDETIASSFQKILQELKNYVNTLSTDDRRIEIATDNVSTIEIKHITNDQIRTIVRNFDIFIKVQSLRTPTIRPNSFNVPDLTWDLRIRPPRTSIKIGVLDNGVRPITPLENIIENHNLDITNKQSPNPLQASHPHGTIVASLAAMGVSFFDTATNDFTSDALIVPIKILNFNQGNFNIYDIETALNSAIRLGVKIFNLSVTGPGKMYNEGVTEFAYLLDKLAYENDILLFISTGNLDKQDIEAMQQHVRAGLHLDFHVYPLHFYNPNKQSDCHVCEAMNLCMPAESFNNITVGAIADNLAPGQAVGLAPFKELPAYYTRKHNIDYTKKINNTEFKRSQVNYNINKPDIVMPGGDLLAHAAAMQVLGFGDQGDFYIKDSGTSLATPLAANLAAKILEIYPSLNMQSVKALIINSATKLLDESFLDDLVLSLKDEYAQVKFKKMYTELSKHEVRQINEKISSEDIYHRIVGYGMPDISKALYSTSKSVTLVIQDTIVINSHKVVNLNLPNYLKDYSKKRYIVELKGTLCYKFPPVWNNHLGYNPLHISFNFIRSAEKNNPVSTAEIIADRDHNYFIKHIGNLKSQKKISKAKKEALGIKKNLESWSEDFYPPSSKPFANTQQLSLKITATELEKIENQLSIVVRCTYKKDVDLPLEQALISSSHPFSIALNISEKENDELSTYDLYEELKSCNELEALSTSDLEAEDLEAEV
ncbi:S8 family peptidase [Flavihumibacter sp.]|uniref:S8 family peptidase n=1 Tax=Flavihumibacter sp. TaxID=1913981 RepID=UPI002FC9A23C